MQLIVFALLPIFLLVGIGTSIYFNTSMINTTSESMEQVESLYQEEIERDTIVINDVEYSIDEYINDSY